MIRRRKIPEEDRYTVRAAGTEKYAAVTQPLHLKIQSEFLPVHQQKQLFLTDVIGAGVVRPDDTGWAEAPTIELPKK